MNQPPSSSAAPPLLYRCPMCGEEVAVERKLFGETVNCPKCEGPFQVEPPKAHPVGEVAVGAAGMIDGGDDATGTAGAATVPPKADGNSHPQKISERATDEWTETVVHPVVFRRHILGTIGSCALMIFGLIAVGFGLTGNALYGYEGTPLWIAGAIAIVIGLYFAGRWYLLSRVQSLTLTNERLVYQYGLIKRETSEVRHDDVRNLKVSQGFVERMLGYGDIAISSAGQDDMEIVINDVPDPQKVADFIRARQ